MKNEKISLSGNEKISLISNLSTMLSAGIPILETVDSLLEDSKGHQKKLLQTLRTDLTQGQHVYQTFAKFPGTFDKVAINIIKASEEAGTLDIALKDLKDNIRRDMEFTDKIKSALFYPLFIFVVFIGVMLMILIVVIPKIATVFISLRIKLPLPTRILIFMSNLILHSTIYVIGVLLAITGLAVYLYKTKRKMFLRALITFPFISSLAKEIDLTRFSRSLYLLLNAGIPITSALELGEDLVVNKEIAKAILHCKNIVSSGKKLSQGFKDAKKVIPNIMIKVTEAGERSGSLEKSMQDASEYLDYQVAGKLKLFTALLEPIMLVVVGMLVGGMMLAIIAPIYGLISQVGTR